MFSILCFVGVSTGHHVMVAPAPHAGVALITALNILEGYNITSQVPRNNTYHWIAEVINCINCFTIVSINSLKSTVCRFI